MVEINFNLLGKPLGDEWLSKGTSKVFNLIFNKQLSKFERAKLLANAQNEYDSNLIKSGIAKFENNIFSAIKTEQDSNLANSLQNSIEYLNELSDDQISDEPVSQTFFNKWANYAKEASEEELQNLWGNILSAEITTPNSVNYLTLNALSLMSQEHLSNFTKLLKYLCYTRYIFYDNTIEDCFPDITPQMIDDFEALNIIKPITNIKFNLRLKQTNVYGKQNSYICKDSQSNHVLYCVSDSEDVIALPALELTSIGVKLSEIAEKNVDISEQCINLSHFLLTLKQFQVIKYIEIQHRHSRLEDGTGLYNKIADIHRNPQ